MTSLVLSGLGMDCPYKLTAPSITKASNTVMRLPVIAKNPPNVGLWIVTWQRDRGGLRLRGSSCRDSRAFFRTAGIFSDARIPICKHGVQFPTGIIGRRGNPIIRIRRGRMRFGAQRASGPQAESRDGLAAEWPGPGQGPRLVAQGLDN